MSKIKENQQHFGTICDITNPSEIKEKFLIVEKKYKIINHLINCAG